MLLLIISLPPTTFCKFIHGLNDVLTCDITCWLVTYSSIQSLNLGKYGFFAPVKATVGFLEASSYGFSLISE